MSETLTSHNSLILKNKERLVTTKEYPISKYVGKYPNGKWIFVKYYEGTYEEALKEAVRLQSIDSQHNQYKIWDDR